MYFFLFIFTLTRQLQFVGKIIENKFFIEKFVERILIHEFFREKQKGKTKSIKYGKSIINSDGQWFSLPSRSLPLFHQ